jgi:predicted nuclease of predicted toxin-antitoxin system
MACRGKGNTAGFLMKILIDMNLPPAWVGFLEEEGHEAVHWSKVGDFGATDTSILAWAKEHEYIVFTHDLDFGAILAASKGISPSVIQMRTQDTFPESCAEMILTALNQFKDELEKGALLSVDRYKARVRILPLKA